MKTGVQKWYLILGNQSWARLSCMLREGQHASCGLHSLQVFDICAHSIWSYKAGRDHLISRDTSPEVQSGVKVAETVPSQPARFVGLVSAVHEACICIIAHWKCVFLLGHGSMACALCLTFPARARAGPLPKCRQAFALVALHLNPPNHCIVST